MREGRLVVCTVSMVCVRVCTVVAGHAKVCRVKEGHVGVHTKERAM